MTCGERQVPPADVQVANIEVKPIEVIYQFCFLTLKEMTFE